MAFFRCSNEVRKLAKLAAVRRQISMQALVEEAIRSHLDEKRVPPQTISIRGECTGIHSPEINALDSPEISARILSKHQRAWLSKLADVLVCGDADAIRIATSAVAMTHKFIKGEPKNERKAPRISNSL